MTSDILLNQEEKDLPHNIFLSYKEGKITNDPHLF